VPSKIAETDGGHEGSACLRPGSAALPHGTDADGEGLERAGGPAGEPRPWSEQQQQRVRRRTHVMRQRSNDDSFAPGTLLAQEEGNECALRRAVVCVVVCVVVYI
jgi:hypothetical protein